MIEVKLQCSNAKENRMMLDELNTHLKKEILDHKIKNSTFYMLKIQKQNHQKLSRS